MLCPRLHKHSPYGLELKRMKKPWAMLSDLSMIGPNAVRDICVINNTKITMVDMIIY